MDRGLWNASFDKLLERILERLGLLDGGSSISLTASRGVVTDANKLLSSDVAATGTGAPVPVAATSEESSLFASVTTPREAVRLIDEPPSKRPSRSNILSSNLSKLAFHNPLSITRLT